MRVLRVEDVTQYRFGAWVTLLPHRLMIRPRENHELRIVSSTLDIERAVLQPEMDVYVRVRPHP
jgi:hypothetical protein